MLEEVDLGAQEGARNDALGLVGIVGAGRARMSEGMSLGMRKIVSNLEGTQTLHNLHPARPAISLLHPTGFGHHTTMAKACLLLAFFCLLAGLPLRAYDWETATFRGREYVTLKSFCGFYGFTYQAPSGNDRFTSRSAKHSVSLKIGNSDMYLDGVHYVLSFPVEGGDHDWLISRMDVIKLFDPILRPTEISGRHSIRGVVIDAGHGGSDNGAQSRLGAEKNYTLDTAFKLEKILRAAGLKTVLVRRTDTFVDLYERAHIASLYPDYAFVSIHFNSATPEARGLETYCLSPRGAASTSSNYVTRSDIQKLPGNDDDQLNILLASMVHSEIIKLNPGDSSMDRGVKRARFVVIKQNQLPAILVEGGFVSNRMESARVNKDDYRQSLAQSIARGVIRFVNIMGNRNMSLPGMDGSSAAPKAIAVLAPTPTPAPSGLAKDTPSVSASGGKNASSSSSGKGSSSSPNGGSKSSGTSSSSKDKDRDKTRDTEKDSDKTKETASNSSTSRKSTSGTSKKTTTSSETGSGSKSKSTAAATPTKTPVKVATPELSGPLSLKEPATPTPAPDSDKAAPEPDEPPTVNIYPTTPLKGPDVSTTPPSEKKAKDESPEKEP